MTEKERSFLRRIYAVRALFALLWAAGLVIAGGELGGATTVLVIVYPAIDVLASLADARVTRLPVQWLNAAISAAALVAIVVATGEDTATVLRVFGAWALVSGAVQLAVALNRRRRVPGQLPMMLSGAISTLAGIGFVSMASADAPDLTNLAGYATLGAIFYLVAARGTGRVVAPQANSEIRR